MSRQGSSTKLLDELHAPNCPEGTYSKMGPVLDPTTNGVTVVLMEWCGDCGAADYEVV